VGVLISITVAELILLEVLDKDNLVFEKLPAHIRWLDGFFQTIMTRTSGFAVFSISSLRIGIQALYLPMMFISAYPTIMAMRSSNVSEERPLGIQSYEMDDLSRNADENNGILTKPGTSGMCRFILDI
jgi:Trk-type K+ transport system membrane component